MSVNSSTYKSFSKRNACILLTQPRLCSCILLQKIYLRCAQERRCCPPNPSHLRRPRTGNTASSAGQEADIYPREGKIKDSMKPCLSPHKKILFPLPVSGKRIFPLTSLVSGCGPSQWVCMWQRVSGTGLNWAPHQSSLSLCHCYLLKDAPEMFSDPAFCFFPDVQAAP